MPSVMMDLILCFNEFYFGLPDLEVFSSGSPWPDRGLTGARHFLRKGQGFTGKYASRPGSRVGWWGEYE